MEKGTSEVVARDHNGPQCLCLDLVHRINHQMKLILEALHRKMLSQARDR